MEDVVSLHCGKQVNCVCNQIDNLTHSVESSVLVLELCEYIDVDKLVANHHMLSPMTTDPSLLQAYCACLT